MGDIVSDLPGLQPFVKSFQEKRIVKGFTPKGAVFNTRLGERAVQVQHTNKSRPLSAPVSYCEYWGAVCCQPSQHMMTILPYTFSHYKWNIRIKLAENFHAYPLRVDETMTFHLIVGVTANNVPPTSVNGRR